MKNINYSIKIWLVWMILILSISCSNSYTPKPRGYFRIEFPEHQYKTFDTTAPFSFEIPSYSFMIPDTTQSAEPYWYNLEFPSMKGKIHMSYKTIDKNLAKYIDDCRTLAYKHTIKADDIIDHPFIDNKNKVFGILYEIKGNAASSFQFFATDSVEHFLRGSLYFNVYPNKDSLSPVFDFVHADIKHLIETIRWKE
jgi:gliding motility-associated lipoprotein GldD